MAVTTTKIDGQVLKVYIDTVLLGYVTEQSFDISANMIETSNKDSGKFAEFIAGRTTSTLSVSALHQFDATEGYKEMFADITAGTSVDVVISNENAGDYEWSATCLISSLSISFPDDDVVSYDMEFQVTGEPTYTVIV